MEPPSNTEAKCPECDEETMHQVLKGRLTKGKGSVIVLDATVKCTECERVHHIHIRQPKPVEVSVIISRDTVSEKSRVELPRGVMLSIKDEIEIQGTLVQITSMEKNGKRVNRAKCEDIDTLWTRLFDTIQVKVSVYKGRKTTPEILVAEPETEFSIGQTIEIKGRFAEIETIKVPQRILRKGSAEARDIVRIYARLFN